MRWKFRGDSNKFRILMMLNFQWILWCAKCDFTSTYLHEYHSLNNYMHILQEHHLSWYNDCIVDFLWLWVQVELFDIQEVQYKYVVEASFHKLVELLTFGVQVELMTLECKCWELSQHVVASEFLVKDSVDRRCDCCIADYRLLVIHMKRMSTFQKWKLKQP